MDWWNPVEEFPGEDAYIVGGGDSLHTFDWELLRGKNVVGCNCAYLLGEDIVPTIVFADEAWWGKIGREGTKKYGGRIVGCTRKRTKDTDIHHMQRKRYGVAGPGEGKLGYNGNTGSLAANLALLLGAKQVYLLGFDMKLGKDDRPNWHDVRHEEGKPGVYPRFIRDFAYFAGELPKVFPGRFVVNVTDGSALPYFQKVPVSEHFGLARRKNEVRVANH